MLSLLINAWAASTVSTASVSSQPYVQQPVQQQPVVVHRLPAPPAAAPAAYGNSEAYKQAIAARALREGVRPATVQAYVPGLRFVSRAVELDRGPQNVTP